MSSNSIISVSSYVRKTLTIAGVQYGIGKIRNSYFVLNMDTDTWRTFTSQSAFSWFLDTLIEAGERLDPTPSPTAPAAHSIRIYEQTTAVAVSNSKQENIVNIPSDTVPAAQTVRAHELQKCVKGMKSLEWAINTGRMNVLDWHELYGRCLIAKSVYGYMPEAWIVKFSDCAELAQARKSKDILPIIRELLEWAKEVQSAYLYPAAPKTSPASTPSTEHTIRIAQKPRAAGMRLPADTPVADAYAAFEAKHGFEANKSYIDATGMLWVGFDPADEKAA